MDVPVHVGFSILQYAKLRMFEFYYDFMDRWVLFAVLWFLLLLAAVPVHCCVTGFFFFFLFIYLFLTLLLTSCGVCLHRYVDRRDFQYIKMDTDSAYMALLLCILW